MVLVEADLKDKAQDALTAACETRWSRSARTLETTMDR